MVLIKVSPALAALILKPKKESRGVLSRFYRWFNDAFGRATNGYASWCGTFIRKAGMSLLFLVLVTGLTGLLGGRLPGGFLPEEDQGYMYAGVQLPDAASLQRTSEVCRQIEEIMADTPGIEYVTTVVGMNMLSGVTNTYSGFFFVTLKPWEERKKPEQKYEAIMASLNGKMSKLPSGVAFAFSPPAIPGIGTAGGVTFILEDRAGKDITFLWGNTQKFLATAQKRPELSRVTTTFVPTVPQIFVKVDRDKVLKQGVDIGEVYRVLQAFMGGYCVNYFNRFGRQWQVYVQAEGEYRAAAEHLGQFYVRNQNGDSVPLSALTSLEPRSGPEFTMRYNLYRSVQINAVNVFGYSSTQGMKALEEVFKETMPAEMGYDYLGMSYQEKKAQEGVPAWVILALSILFVFLILSAQYEIWSLPFSVLLGTPIAVFGAFLGIFMRNMELNLYAQIGLVFGDLSWELDFFGRIRQATEAARAEFFASEDNRKFVIQTLVTDLARAYIELRALDQQLEISNRTVKVREESLKLVKARFDYGWDSLTPVLMTENLVHGARAGVRVAEAVQQEALLTYKKSIQQAFQEVSDSLVGVRMLKEVRLESGKQVKALSQQTGLAYQRYYGGVTPYLEVLDSDRQLFESEIKLTQDRANEFLAVIALYRALGGGWQNGNEPAGSQN